MLFNATIHNLDNHIEELNQEIKELEDKLQYLRKSVTQVEQHKQALMTAESACESALQQLEKAITVTRQVDANQLDNLREVVNDLFTRVSVVALPFEPEGNKPEPEPDLEIEDNSTEDLERENNLPNGKEYDLEKLTTKELRKKADELDIDKRIKSRKRLLQEIEVKRYSSIN